MDKCTQPWTNACTHAPNHGPNHGQMHAHMHESTTFCIALQLQPPGLASTTAWQLWQLLSCGSCGSRKGGPLAAVAAANTGSCSSRQRESKPAPPCTGKGKQAWGLAAAAAANNGLSERRDQLANSRCPERNACATAVCVCVHLNFELRTITGP